MDAQLLNFDGDTFQPEHDSARLTGQLSAVKSLMADGAFRTLRQIATHVHGSEAGVSARLRDLRKPRFGAHVVNRKRIAGGLWMYQVIVSEGR